MNLKLYNTLTRTKETFTPLVPGKVGMYLCGPTVYDYSHLGHLIGPVIFDTFKRYLQYSGYDVTWVVNITDVDDKIINRAKEMKIAPEELTAKITADYFEHLQRLKVHIDHFPRATQYIGEMIDLISKLIEQDVAYMAGGDVYFDVTRHAEYGKLSNRKLEEMFAGTRKEVSDLKRHPGDFALWKSAKPGEPQWPSPFGAGRPGWHTECVAMSMKILGETFDIHGGGLDLCFPHHEDEIAQAECLTHKPFARYWLHNNLMTDPKGGKIGKSEGNAIAMRELLKEHTPEELRYFLISTHYRSPIIFADGRIAEVGKGLNKLYTFARRLGKVLPISLYDQPFATTRQAGDEQIQQALAAVVNPSADHAFLSEVADLRQRYVEAMDDDLNTSGAVSFIFELLNAANRFIEERSLENSAKADPLNVRSLEVAVRVLREFCAILGLLEEAPPAMGAAAQQDSITPQLVQMLLTLRAELRGLKQFALADRIRAELKELGIVLEDRPDGTGWHFSKG